MKIPSGNSGKAVVMELSRLFKAFATASSLESVALKAAFILPPLLLQRHKDLRDGTNRKVLDRRLKSWKQGHLQELLAEGRTIQQ